MNQEFLRIKDGQENAGLDGALETNTGPVTYPLHKRLNEFLIFAKPKVSMYLASLLPVVVVVVVVHTSIPRSEMYVFPCIQTSTVQYSSAQYIHTCIHTYTYILVCTDWHDEGGVEDN